MTKPTPVIVAIVVFSLFTIISILPFIYSYSFIAYPFVLYIALICTCLDILGVIGLLRRTPWSRFYSIVIFGLWFSIAMVMYGFFWKQMNNTFAFITCFFISAPVFVACL